MKLYLIIVEFVTPKTEWSVDPSGQNPSFPLIVEIGHKMHFTLTSDKQAEEAVKILYPDARDIVVQVVMEVARVEPEHTRLK